MKLPSVEATPIPGLRRISLDIREDERGWFEETYQSEKFADLGLGFFRPVQANASHNLQVGVTRGFHAEPWSKLVTVTNGAVFSAWVDLRPGLTFGATHTAEIRPGTSFFVPKGVANSYQSLEAGTSYIYLVDGIWRPSLSYPSINLFDTSQAIEWPIPAGKASVSPKDLANPSSLKLAETQPEIVIFGSGQVSKALQIQFPSARVITRAYFDFGEATESQLGDLIPFDSIVVNAAAFTKVDLAETKGGFDEAMRINFDFPRKLALASKNKSATLIHYSSDYVFTGDASEPYTETETPKPRTKYGISKYLGDLSVDACAHAYIVRTSWVYGDGPNFIRAILGLARQGKPLEVVDDQLGRPTSAEQIAKFTAHLLDTHQDFGTYNLTGAGDVTSWHEVARTTLDAVGINTSSLAPKTSDEYAEGKNLADRPKFSVLDLRKVESTGFKPEDWKLGVQNYAKSLF
jgi:dTDP-4-dehydrorhamnose 3,5-epimerase/reductase